MGRSRRLVAGVVASWVVLPSFWTEASALSTGYIGSAGGDCTKSARGGAVASSSRTSRLLTAAVPSRSLIKTCYGGYSWRHGDDNYPFMARLLKKTSGVDDAAGTAEMNRPKEFGSPLPSATCLRAVADSSGSSEHSRYEQVSREERASVGREPTGNILQRLSMIALERSAAAKPQSTVSSTQTSLSMLPSDPIKRFSSDCRIGDNKAIGSNRGSSESTSSTPSGKVFNASGPSVLKAFAEAGGTPSSLADLVTELRRRTILSGQLHRGSRSQSGQEQPPIGIDHGVQQLNSVITRVEAKLELDSSEAGQLRVRNNHRVFEEIHWNENE